MNRTVFSVVLASMTALASFGCTANRTAQCQCCAALPAGANTAVSPTTADALRSALLDERRAQTFYQNVMAKHGNVRPFANIVHAEVRHAQMVTDLMNRHGVAVPNEPLANLPEVPGTLAECNRLAAQLERENIDMYDRLLKDVTEPDIRAVFSNLRAASLNNHLPAFERWSTGAVSPGAARGTSVGYGAGRQ